MLTEEQKARIRARAKARLAEGCKKEEGLISTINGAIDNVQNLVTGVLEAKELPAKEELEESASKESGESLVESKEIPTYTLDELRAAVWAGLDLDISGERSDEEG
jgi:hypothetical protein